MTRTGKSNTVKKVIEATTEINNKSTDTCNEASASSAIDNVNQFKDDGIPKYKVGQIIFDMNGEYANANLQDEGTAIFEKYVQITTRYSVLDKPGFKVLKVNFYNEISVSLELICSLLADESGDYIKSFTAIALQAKIEGIYEKYPKVLAVFDSETESELTEEECAALIEVSNIIRIINQKLL